MRTLVRFIATVVSGLSTLGAAAFALLAYRANEDLWHQGPTVVVISPTHGLHEMDVLLLSAAAVSALLALLAALIARR